MVLAICPVSRRGSSIPGVREFCCSRRRKIRRRGDKSGVSGIRFPLTPTLLSLVLRC